MRISLIIICLSLLCLRVTGQGCIAPSATINAGSGNPNQGVVFICSDGSNTVTFTIPGGSTDHSVIWQYQLPSGGAWTQLTNSPNNTRFENVATFSNVMPGFYRYQSGVSACGASPSPALSLSAVSGVPSAPSLSASSVCATPVTLSASSDNSAFQNTYYLQPSTIVSSTVSSAGSYYATATNVCGESPISNIIVIKTTRLQSSGPISISDINKALGRPLNSSSSSLFNQVSSADNQVSKSAPYRLSSFYNYCY